MSALADWARQLGDWQIPAEILDAAPDSPWVLPRSVFVRRADQQVANPVGATHAEAIAALAEPGSVLDIGAAAGATSLPLIGRAPVTAMTAIDTDAELLAAFAERATIPVRCVRGQWPDAAEELTDQADVVLAGNILYNVADLTPFVTALTAAARRTVIVETADHHPLTALNPLWQHFHGIDRPTGPTVHDAIAALAELGITPRVRHWQRPKAAEHASYDDLLDVTRRRLCLPTGALAEIDMVLRKNGVDPALPPDLGSSGTDLTTLSWDGTPNGTKSRTQP